MFEGLKVYIAGPITGTDDYKERFAAAEMYLRDQGAIPMHSAGLPQGFDHEQYLYICFAMIDVCEAVYFMDGYSESEGSKKEFCYAALKNKQLLYEDIDPAWKLDDVIAGLENRTLYGTEEMDMLYECIECKSTEVVSKKDHIRDGRTCKKCCGHMKPLGYIGIDLASGESQSS